MPWISSMFSGSSASAGGAVQATVGDSFWSSLTNYLEDVFEGRTIVREPLPPAGPETEMVEFPKLPKTTDDIMGHVTDRWEGPEPVEDFDLDFGGIQPPPGEVLNEFDALDLDATLAKATELNRLADVATGLRSELGEIIGAPIEPYLSKVAAARAAESRLAFNSMRNDYGTVEEILAPYELENPNPGGLAEALLRQQRENAINLAFFDDKPDPWAVEPYAAEDFDATYPLLGHAETAVKDVQPSLWSRLTGTKALIGADEIADDLALGLERIRAADSIFGMVSQTEQEMLLAANQAVTVSRAGLSAAESTPAYLASLEMAEAGWLTALKSMTWGQVAEGLFNAALSAGIMIGFSFLGNYLLQLAEEHKQALLKEYGYSEEEAWEAGLPISSGGYSDAGNVGFFIMGKVSYPCKVIERQHDDKSYQILFEDVFQFKHTTIASEKTIGFFYNKETKKPVKRWDLSPELEKEWKIRNNETMKIIPQYPVIPDGALIKMLSDGTLGRVKERDFEKKMYRIKAIPDVRGHFWFALPSEFSVSTVPYDEVTKVAPPSITDVMERFGRMFPDKKDTPPPVVTPPVAPVVTPDKDLELEWLQN